MKHPHNISLTRKPLIATLVIAIVAIIFAGAGYTYTVSPPPVRFPKIEHAHIRMQLIVDSKAVNFGADKFQEAFNKDICSDKLPKTPIHFHDSKDQFVHLHWKGMTGGLILKYYGWNMVGGANNMMGYRWDKLPAIESVKIFGTVLPAFPDSSKLWVYTGDVKSHQERSTDEFLHQDVETFFGVKSRVNPEVASLLDMLFPKAMAHAGEEHSGKSEAELKRIQNFLGNVVIFVQKSKPNELQVAERFTKLEPLSDSTCGG